MNKREETVHPTITIPVSKFEELICLAEKTEELQNQLAELKRLVFGRKSERFISAHDDNQLTLFQQQTAVETQVITEEISYSRTKAKRAENKKPSRNLLPAHLPRVEEVIEPSIDTGNMVKIGEEISEYLESQPAKVWVRKIIRPRYAEKRENEENNKIHIADLPPSPIHKSKAGASLLSQILVDKFLYHLPLLRQDKSCK